MILMILTFFTYSCLGFAGLVFVCRFAKDHFRDNHGTLGLVLTAFVTIQVVAAIFRPSAPKQANQDELGNIVVSPSTMLRERVGGGGGRGGDEDKGDMREWTGGGV